MNGTEKKKKSNKKAPTQNTNPFEPWTFDEPELKHLKGWMRQKRGGRTDYQYKPPKGAMCKSIKAVKRWVENNK